MYVGEIRNTEKTNYIIQITTLQISKNPSTTNYQLQLQHYKFQKIRRQNIEKKRLKKSKCEKILWENSNRQIIYCDRNRKFEIIVINVANDSFRVGFVKIIGR